MANIYVVIKSFYVPYIVMGGLGGVIFFFSPSKKKKHFFVVLTCIGMMILWRLKMKGLNSSRYTENLFVITAVGSAYFLLNWDNLLFWKEKEKKQLCTTIKIIFAALVIALIFLFKFSHYNKQYMNYHNISDSIVFNQGQERNHNTAIITIKDQRLYNHDLPQISIPPFLLNRNNPSFEVLNAISHFEWLYKKLFFVSDWNPKSIKCEFAGNSPIKLIGKYNKNDQRKYIYLYSFSSPQHIERIEQLNTISTASSLNEEKLNLFKNGDFESERSRINSDKEYYDRIHLQSAPAKKNVIPDNSVFPSYWDIIWAYGFSQETIASIYISKDKPISGNNSLYLDCNNTISFLYEGLLPADNYVFQCDIYPLKKTSFGIQFSLRNDYYELEGFREISKVTLNKTDQTYHYLLEIPKEMFFPYKFFYFYFYIYGSGNIIVDNFSLEKK